MTFTNSNVQKTSSFECVQQDDSHDFPMPRGFQGKGVGIPSCWLGFRCHGEITAVSAVFFLVAMITQLTLIQPALSKSNQQQRWGSNQQTFKLPWKKTERAFQYAQSSQSPVFDPVAFVGNIPTELPQNHSYHWRYTKH